MAITAGELVRRALFLANVLDPNEEPDPYYINEGYNVFAELIDEWSSLGIYIPYTNTVVIPLLPNVSNYTVSPEIIEVQEAKVLDSYGVIYTVDIINTQIYNALNFPQTFGRPNQLFVTDDQNFININTGQLSSLVYVYPTPDTNYTLTLILKQKFVALDIFTPMTNVPSYYMKALRYQLASEYRDIYGTELSPQFEKEYALAMKKIEAANPRDWSIIVNNVFQGFRRYRPWSKYYVG